MSRIFILYSESSFILLKFYLSPFDLFDRLPDFNTKRIIESVSKTKLLVTNCGIG